MPVPVRRLQGQRRLGWPAVGLELGELSLGFHHQTNGFAHRSCAASGQQHSTEEASLKGLHVHIGLIRFDHQHRFTALNAVAGLLQPLNDLPLSHR